MRGRSWQLAGLLALLGGLAPHGPVAAADAVEEFYRGKQITLYIGYEPGGSYDTYARLAGSHLAAFIPGHPTIVPKNMPGVGGLKATDFLFAQAPRDGTAIGIAPQGIALEQALGNPAVQYDARQFAWIGHLSSVTESLVAWHGSPIKTIQDAMQHEMIVAATSPNSTTETNPKLINRLAGTKLKIILGYAGVTGSLLAIERGEAEASTAPIEDLLVSKGDWLRDGTIRILVQYAQQRHPAFPDVPTMVDLATNPEDRQIMALYGSIADVGRTLIAPPGVPEPRVAALRTAFDAMMRDADFQAELAQAKIEVEPVSGAEMQRRIEQTLDVPDTVLARAKQLRD